MSQFNFKSAICTNRQQSERLLSLGLKKETADMVLVPSSKHDGTDVVRVRKSYLMEEDSIPAWSLHRLIEMVAGGSEEQMIFLPDPYDELIEEIAGAIMVGCFPKEYLD